MLSSQKSNSFIFAIIRMNIDTDQQLRTRTRVCWFIILKSKQWWKLNFNKNVLFNIYVHAAFDEIFSYCFFFFAWHFQSRLHLMLALMLVKTSCSINSLAFATSFLPTKELHIFFGVFRMTRLKWRFSFEDFIDSWLRTTLYSALCFFSITFPVM